MPIDKPAPLLYYRYMRGAGFSHIRSGQMDITHGNGWGKVERAAAHGDEYAQCLLTMFDRAEDTIARTNDPASAAYWLERSNQITQLADAHASYLRSQA